jgi:predicted RNA-binding protein with RPS1 domain
MSEDMTNVVDDEADVAATPATDPTATATPAEVVSTPADEDAPETASAVADATPADEATAESAESEASAEPVADATPTEDVVAESASSDTSAEVVANWSPTQETAEPVADVAVTAEGDAPVADATATTEGTEAAATPAAEGGERPRRRDRDGKRERGGGGGGNRNANKRKLDTVQVGEEMQGVVRSLQTYGAFVDVGAERDGLVHISELRDGFVEKVEDVVKEGDTVSVRVKEVDVSKGRLSLTMRPPRPVREERAPREPRPAGESAPTESTVDRPRRERNFGPSERREGSGERREAGERREGGGGERRERSEGRAPREGDDSRIKLRDLVEGATLTGKVTSLVDYGAFVDIGAATDGLVHISEIQDERVNKVSDVLSEGQEVQVRILSVDKKRNRVSLSMKPAGEAIDTSYQYEDDDAGIEVASPMKDAFDRAREKKRRDKRGGDKGRKNRYDDDMDDIISRTLRWRD